MADYLNKISDYIQNKNIIHFKKINKNLERLDSKDQIDANKFYNRYEKFLNATGKDFLYGIDCYLKMIDDVNSETLDFFRTGKYSSTSYDEVYNRVYNNPEVMEYYMHGLIVSQYVWKQHYQSNRFFLNKSQDFIPITKRYLEIGVGHGLLLSESLRCFQKNTTFHAVDISQTSIDFSKKFIDSPRVKFMLCDIFKYIPESKYDFISMGEVLEHVEQPSELLNQIKSLMNQNGVLYITTPTNAPAIDHIFLFESIDHIESIIQDCGFKIVHRHVVNTEDKSPEEIKKFKISQHYSAFLKINS